jgi:predicted metal-dependent hydrolase
MQRLNLIGVNEISLDGQSIKYNLKKSLRARHMRLEIHLASGLSVIVPRRYDLRSIEHFLQKKRKWILNKLEEYRLFQSKLTTRPHNNVTYLGRTLKLIELRGSQECAQVGLDPDKIIVSASTKEGINQVLKAWYFQEARELITHKVAVFSDLIGVKYNKLTVKSVRTRWGSCSRLGNLNFSWKLIMFPEMVIDYVIVHELCHLKRMDHSPTFWKLVQKYCPDCFQHRKWLKDNELKVNSLPF